MFSYGTAWKKVLFWQTFSGHFIHILFPWHDHEFTEYYTDNFMENIMEMLTHVCAIGTRPLFPLLRNLGTRVALHVHSTITVHAMIPNPEYGHAAKNFKMLICRASCIIIDIPILGWGS